MEILKKLVIIKISDSSLEKAEVHKVLFLSLNKQTVNA